MKVREMYEQLGAILRLRPHCAELDVLIKRSDPSCGPMATSGVRSMGIGFDWDKDLILWPELPLVTLKEQEALWQMAHNLIYMLSKEVRYYKGQARPTELSKRAQRILDKAKECRQK